MMPAGPRQRGAEVSGHRSLPSRLFVFVSAHAQGFFSSLGRLVKMPFSTLTAGLVVAVALSLPTVFYVLVDNARLLSSSFVDSNQVTLFLRPVVSDVKAESIAGGLLKRPEILSVRVITKAQALDEFKQYSGFSAAIGMLDQNPLPALIQFDSRSALDPDQLARLSRDLERMPEVDFVQFDLQWIRRLRAIMEFVERGVEMLSLLLGVGVVFVVSNTIRLELRTRHEEIVIARLLGATDAFIRRPFLYSGFWYGLVGGILAAALATLILASFEEPIRHLASLYDTDYQLSHLGLYRIIGLCAVSSLLGIAGAWMVLFDQLRKMHPHR
jgi:cell division transport system permease protein